MNLAIIGSTAIFAGTAAMFWLSPEAVQALQVALLAGLYAYVIIRAQP